MAFGSRRYHANSVSLLHVLIDGPIGCLSKKRLSPRQSTSMAVSCRHFLYLRNCLYSDAVSIRMHLRPNGLCVREHEERRNTGPSNEVRVSIFTLRNAST